MSTRSFTVSVVVPLYNEEKTISIILDKLLQLEFVSEIIVVNDASTDKSAAQVEKYVGEKIRLFSLEKNSGKTAAINYALKRVTSDYVVIQDADLEYNPEEIRDLFVPIFSGQADVVYGSRFLVKRATRILYFYHFLANKSITFLSNVFTNLNMTDVETCYKVFPARVFKNFDLTSSGFGMEIEITAILAKLRLRIYEVPISYYGRTYEEGKKIKFSDGIMAFLYIFAYNLFYPRIPRVKKHLRELKDSHNLLQVQ